MVVFAVFVSVNYWPAFPGSHGISRGLGKLEIVIPTRYRNYLGVIKLGNPFLDAVADYCTHKILPLHTPGHKQGAGVSAEFGEAWENWGLKLDIDPPLLPTGDSWVLPTTLLKPAREKAASLFGAQETFFLTNGTSSGIQAMFLAAGRQGKVVLPRHVHASVISALIISGCEPVFLSSVRTSQGIPDSRMDSAELRQVLSTVPGISAVFAQNPSYYGFAADLAEVAEIAHEYDLPLLVDEAHGPHFCFSADLPVSALAAGADLVAQSTHKLLTSLSGSSMLHVAKGRAEEFAVGRFVDLVTSTSPSFLLLASLEAAVYQLAKDGKELVGQTIKLARDFRDRAAEIPGITVLGDAEIRELGYLAYDQTKLVLDFSDFGISGLKAAEILRADYLIQVEMADFQRVLAVLGPGDDREATSRLELALRDFSKYRSQEPLPDPPIMPKSGPMAITPRQAFFSLSQEVPLAEASGRVSAEVVAPYPPGIPVLIPGEIITDEQIQYLQELSIHGFKIAGAKGETRQQIRVVV